MAVSFRALSEPLHRSNRHAADRLRIGRPMAIDGTAGTLAGSQACAVFTAQPGGAGFNGLSFREKGGQARAVPRPCPERRETRPAERRRPGWAKGEDRPFLDGAKRIVPHVSIPDERTGHSREGVPRAHSATGIRKATGAERCSRRGYRDSSCQSPLTWQAESFDRMPLRSIFADLMSRVV